MASVKKPPCCKVVLLGDSGVGKTCIISRYISGAFDQNSPTTNGASYASKIVEIANKSVSLDIWDTAGQEKYKSLTKFFYKDAKVAILVYDITQKESFTNMKQYWYEQLKEFGSKDIIIGVAGNKCDMYEKEDVSENEGKEFAEQIGAFFEMTSAKNNTGINDLFMNAAQRFFDPNYKQNPEDGKENIESEGKVKLDSNAQKNQRRRCC
jgi:Ras-related protein Rab-22